MFTNSGFIRAVQTVSLCVLTALYATAIYAEQAADEASAVPETAEATIDLVTTDLLASLQELSDVYDESPDEFYSGIDAIVSPWIDYDAFFKGVMGRKYYTAATQDQRNRFKEVFHTSLIQTYGKGLLGVEETRFEIAPAKPPRKEGGPVQVEQTLFSGSGRIVVLYTMAQSDAGRWQLRNVILEGINLGKTFRNQFARSAREHQEDLDKVIEDWSSNI